MGSIAVTGAAGPVGRRVVQLLAADPGVGEVRAFDRAPLVGLPARVQRHQLDTAAPALAERLAGCDSVVHLINAGAAAAPGRRGDGARPGAVQADAAGAVTLLNRVLAAAGTAGCAHVVLVSSALVYGARADNPVPLTEAHPRRPVPALAYATTAACLEQLAEQWSASTGAGLAVLRPTTTLSERGVSWIAGALRQATSLRATSLQADVVEPPVQFLHHDDLASAVMAVATGGRVGVWNVAPDGWIGPDVFRRLLAEAELRPPEPFDGLYARVVRFRPDRRVEPGLAEHVAHPWVVANDRLRATGWAPRFTNEEAFVLGNPPPLWRTFTLRRRQELALGLVTAAAGGAVAAAGFAGRRYLRR